MRKDTKHKHLDYSYSPISHSQVLHSQTLFIIDVPWYVETNYEGSTACCGAAYDLDVQRSACQTEAMMNQNHTGIGSNSRNSENKKLILGMLMRVIVPDNVYPALLLPSSRRIHAEPQKHGLLDHSPAAHGCGYYRPPHRRTRYRSPNLESARDR